MKSFLYSIAPLSVPLLRNVPKSGNNHFQERNSPETKKKLRDLYFGTFGPYWIVREK
jgi:hypothetical protein